MTRKLLIALTVAVLATPALAQPAYDDGRPARDPRSDPYYDNGYREDGGRDRVYRGNDGRYSQECHRSSGTTGLLAGGAGGAILGSVLGGGALGTILGAVGGGILGKNLDQKHDSAQNYRNGC